MVKASIARRLARNAFPGSLLKTTLLLTSQPTNSFPFISPPPIKKENKMLHLKKFLKSWMGMAKMNEIAIPINVTSNKSRK